MSEHEIARVTDVDPGSPAIVDVNGRTIGVFAVDNGYVGLPNRCPHQGAPLCEGPVSGAFGADRDNDFELTWELEGKVVACPWHDLQFNVLTGECIALEEYDLPTYAVTERDGRLFVEL
jgi:nitrite reductase/ring-hydroxylating ferredoxin subunit